MRSLIFRQKKGLPVVGVIIFAIVMAFIGFEIRGFVAYDPIIPYTWSAKLTEFMVTRAPIDTPFSPKHGCPEYNDVVRAMGQTWKHSWGQQEFYYVDPLDPTAPIEPVIDRGVSYSDVGVVKWRYKQDEPYIAFELAGNWTNYFENSNGKGTSVQDISDRITEFRNRMESIEFVFSEPNNIPLYRYPDGAFARKIGFTKGDYLYHISIIEDSVPYDPAMPEEDLPTDFQKPVHIAMNCAENSPELRDMYEQYLDRPRDFTNETSIVYGGRKDNVARFTLYFPGGVVDQIQDEFYDTRSKPMQLVTKGNNFFHCSTFEKLKIGKEYPCFRPEKKEFSVVNY